MPYLCKIFLEESKHHYQKLFESQGMNQVDNDKSETRKDGYNNRKA